MSFAKHAPPESNGQEKTLGLPARERHDSRDQTRWVVAGTASIFLAIIVWIALGQAVRNRFVSYDDYEYVVLNPKVTHGLTLDGIRWALTHAHASNWHPLTMISHMLDCQLFGLQPWGHHLTNILLHAAAAILLFLAFRELTGELWPSLLVAAVFAVHPLRVESVAWVSERKDVLSGVFFMFIIWTYARYAHGNGARSFRYIAVVLLFALGLMCKPTLVTVPFVLLLLDYWPLRREKPSSSISRGTATHIWPRLIVEKLPLFALSAASCVATLLAQKQALEGSFKPPLGERVGNALISYVAYIGQMIWPARLAVLYPYPEGNLKVPQVILALLLLITICLVFFLWRKKYPFLLVGWLWYLGMLVPMIGIVHVGSQVRADRYTYLPQIGLYVLLVWSATELFYRWRGTRKILVITAVLIIIAFTTRSYLQVSYWRDSETLWKHSIASTSNNYIVHNNLGYTLWQSGRFAEAIAEWQKALKIKPDFAVAHNNLGAALLQNKQRVDGARGQNGAFDDAIEHYRKALQIKPDFTKAHINLGDALLQKGQIDEAIAHFQKALETQPNDAETETALGNALLQKRQVEEAIKHYQKALQIDPDYPEARYNLGNALVAEGKYNDSIAAYEAAARSRPDYYEAHYNLGCVLAAIGKNDEALKQFSEALRINGNSAESHCYLGILLGRMGHREEGIAHLNEALWLKPDYKFAKEQLRELGAPVPQQSQP